MVEERETQSDHPLIQLGNFTLNSGRESKWKLVADRFIRDNLDGLAYLISRSVPLFGSVEGVPRGGLLLAEALKRHCVQETEDHNPQLPHLIVDDVLTTGGSMERLKATHSGKNGRTIFGAVVFARGPLPAWVQCVLQMPECFWLLP